MDRAWMTCGGSTGGEEGPRLGDKEYNCLEVKSTRIQTTCWIKLDNNYPKTEAIAVHRSNTDNKDVP